MQVSAEAVDAEFEAVYLELKRVAHVPGFRVGQAPRDLLERFHGQKAREQVLQRLVSRSLDEALSAQGNLDLVGRPQVAQVKLEAHQPLTYIAQVEVAPEVPLGRYKGLKLSRPKGEISEDAVGQVLEHLRQTQAELKPVLEDRSAVDGDFLLVDVSEKQPGKPPQKQQGVVMHLNLEKDTEGLLKGLVGMKPGETRSLSTKEGVTLTVSLKGLKAKDIPALDDALARSVGPYDSLEALRDTVRKDLQHRAEASQQQALEAQALQQLLDGWQMEVPPSLVASQARRILKERAVEMMSQGVPATQVQDQAQLLTDQAKLDALKQVKLFFILRRVASAEGFTASEQEIDAKIQQLGQRLRLSPEEVRKDLESRDLMEELVWGVIRGKVVDLILKEAKVEDLK